MRAPDSPPPSAWNALFLAWLVALAATLGALFTGEIMGQAPCVLCWHQRIFMFPLAIILGISLYRNDYQVGWYALPLAAAGWLTAGFHALLYFGVLPEAVKPCGTQVSCSDAAMTILGGIPLPLLSAGAFTLILIFLTLASRSKTP